MSYKQLLCLFLFTCVASVPVVCAQQDGQDEGESVRQVFFATRPAGTNSSGKKSAGSASSTSAKSGAGKSSTHAAGKSDGAKKSTGGAGASSAKTGGSSNVGGANGNAKSGGAATSSGGATSSGSNAATGATAESIGLGYTLFLRNESGDAVRVEPSREFHAGDQIRLALESNADGYLYIFHTEDGRNPQMLFPDVRLTRGDNRVRAHVPYQVPASLSDWFKFDATPAVERLYIVLARRPLTGVPTGDDLLKAAHLDTAVTAVTPTTPTAEQIADYCKQNAERCTWRPLGATWERIAAASGAPVAVSRSEDAGQLQTTAERNATVRGLTLSQSEPSPSVIRMTSAANASMLVTTVDLVHK